MKASEFKAEIKGNGIVEFTAERPGVIARYDALKDSWLVTQGDKYDTWRNYGDVLLKTFGDVVEQARTSEEIGENERKTALKDLAILEETLKNMSQHNGDRSFVQYQADRLRFELGIEKPQLPAAIQNLIVRVRNFAAQAGALRATVSYEFAENAAKVSVKNVRDHQYQKIVKLVSGLESWRLAGNSYLQGTLTLNFR